MPPPLVSGPDPGLDDIARFHEFFDVASVIDRDEFLSITREVMEASLLIFSPFGLPSRYSQENQPVQPPSSPFTIIEHSTTREVLLSPLYYYNDFRFP